MEKDITIGEIYDIFKKYGNLDIEVETQYGYKKILACDITAYNSKNYTIETNEFSLICSTEHLIKNENSQFVEANKYNIGDRIQTKNGIQEISLIKLNKGTQNLYDIQVDEVEEYYSNGIVSHNSSIIKIIQFVLFGVLPNNSTLYSFINKHNRSKEAEGEIIFDKLGKHYKIKRTIKPKKGKKADSGLDFEEISVTGEFLNSLNGSTKTETEKNIKKYLGINDYFEILSIFSAQKKQVEFIDCKNAERLTLLNKFLNLQEFEEKEVKVKDEIKLKDGILKNKLSEYETKFNLKELTEQILQHEAELKLQLTDLDSKNKELNKIREEFTGVNQIYNENYNTSLLNSDKSELEAKMADLNQTESVTIKEIEETKIQLKNIKEDIILSEEEYNKSFNLFEDKKIDYQNNYNLKSFVPFTREKEIGSLEAEIKYLHNDINELTRQSLIDTCSICGSKIKKETLEEIKVKKSDKEYLLYQSEKTLNSFIEKEQKYKDEYYLILSDEEIVKTNLKSLELKKTDSFKLEQKISTLEVEVSMIENKKLKIIQQIEKVEDVIKAKKIIDNISETYYNLKEKESEYIKRIEGLQSQIKENEILLKFLNEKVITSKDLKIEIDRLEKELFIYKTYREIVSKKGLPLFVLNNNIDAINNKINAIVSQVFDFELNFNVNDEKGEVSITFIYPEDEEANEVTLASGSETFLINLCIKVGLSQISKLPKISTLFVDEGYDVLDSDSISKLPNVFDVLKNYYNNIYTITHLDEVKEILDFKIELIKQKGYTTLID